MKRKLLKIICLGVFISVILPLIAKSNLDAEPDYSVKGIYKGQAAQGMAIYGNLAFLLNNTGLCRILDLKTGEIKYDFPLASYHKSNHANCASFGKEFYDGNDIPVLYVSECSWPHRCFVENINCGKPTLVQTIQAIEKGKPKLTHDWIVDDKGHYLYTFTRTGRKNSKGEIIHSIVKYRLPLLSEGNDVKLNEDDVIDQFEIAFISMGQGGTIKGRYLYLPVGLSSKEDLKRIDSKRYIIVVDLKKKRIKKMINLDDAIYDEPEDASFYGKQLFIYCGQEGGLWHVAK